MMPIWLAIDILFIDNICHVPWQTSRLEQWFNISHIHTKSLKNPINAVSVKTPHEMIAFAFSSMFIFNVYVYIGSHY